MAPTVIFHTGDNGRTVDVMAGQCLAVVLEENPTTGYRWSDPEFDAQCLTLDSDDFARAPVAGAVMGVGGTRTFLFKTGGNCRTTLHTELKRSWDRGVAPAATFTLTPVVGK